MNDPKDQPIDIEEQRAWLIEHKAARGFTWPDLAGRTEVKQGTLSSFASGKYNAPGDKIAAAIFRYRQSLAHQAALSVKAPEPPPYFATETSERLLQLLTTAQRGRIVTAAMSAGLGKTESAKHYKACNPNVFIVTCRPSASSVLNTQRLILARLGTINTVGTMLDLTLRIEKMLSDLHRPLLIFDEAQHLTEKTVEEIRSLYDGVGVGIALFGNEIVQQRLEGITRSPAFAQIFSRIALPHVQTQPLAADIEALLDAWEVRDGPARNFVTKVAMKPGALRVASYTLEMATILARSNDSEVELNHVQDGWAQISSRGPQL